MNKILALKWTRLLSYITGGGLTAAFALGGPRWAAVGVALISVAGALGALFPSPAQNVVQDACIVKPDGTPTGATNISSSSELLKH